MIFQYTWPQVIIQQKTATRRLIKPAEIAVRGRHNKIIAVQQHGRAKWRVGTTYAVQQGRGKKQIARIRLTRITRQKISRITNVAAHAEGFTDRQAFLQTWERIHGPNCKNYRVWVLEFELVETPPALKNFIWENMRQHSVLAVENEIS